MALFNVNSYKTSLTIVLMLIAFIAKAQKTVVCDSYGDLYDFNPKTCAYTALADCGRSLYGDAFSVAMRKDTLYILTTRSIIYRQILNKPNSCKLIARSPYQGNAMTIGPDGTLYICAGNTLLGINSYSGQQTFIRNLPYFSAGDLFFYKKELYLASDQGIIQINIEEPSLSRLYIPNQASFFGIINIPDGCNQNKVYGISSSIYELDFENRRIGRIVCTPQISIFDAASITENGYTEGVNIDAINVENICSPATSIGSIQVKAGTAAPGSTLTYSINGGATNQSGVFPNLAEGVYAINVKASNGCFADSVATIRKGSVPKVSVLIQPDTCFKAVGSIHIAGSTNAPPLTYTLNNTMSQTEPLYEKLHAKQYKLRGTTAIGCYMDTSFTINSYMPPTPLKAISAIPEICNLGSITLSYENRVNAVRLNQIPLGQPTTIPDLRANVYTVTLETDRCNYDTLIEVKKELPEHPNILILADTPTCTAKKDGAIRFDITGNNAPFSLYSNDTLASTPNFQMLANGNYTFKIKDNAGCIWDTAVSLFYTRVKPGSVINTSNAICWLKPNGAVSLSITGKDQPYTFAFNNNSYASNDSIKSLYSGSYQLQIADKNNCITDTLQAVVGTTNSALQIENIQSTPTLCDAGTGTITFTMNENAGQVYLSLNNQAFQDKLFYDGLKEGTQYFKLKDNNGCVADTSQSIALQKLPTPVQNIRLTPEICEKKGSIAIELFSGKTATNFRLNNGIVQESPFFANVSAGVHYISFIYNGCSFDTLATVEKTTTQKPSIGITTRDVDCYDRNNGHISINAGNGSSPYTYSYNNSPFINDAKITSLTPGNYTISIKDSYGCIWDTIATINPFVIIKPSVNLIARTPVCFVDERATLQVFINGPETPYRYSIGNSLYNTGNEIKLLPGMYQAYVNNKTGCVLDSVQIDLSYSQTGILPCDTIMVPNAFTPNGDMKNDYLRPVVNYGFVSDYSFSVFNRLGQLLFHTTAINKGWDGKINGQVQPPASYVWMMQYKTRAGKHVTQKGTAVLIR
ncbi:gliding motility-associated C-terminal domain-containing protein [Danxiaibacter flavus]|uniref:Gliding motility-associated C-terminal domain-containing protein n=1 Tax=Danxiaibacter flavus TaxID=3049108 RepID=A0ABV3ZAH5_9BACT|nr:gliding motility-associated C-terminal domain-containing protein [Chitinophagaceae bacterium DXS]